MPRKRRSDKDGPDVYQSDATIAARAVSVARWFQKWATSRKHENSLVTITIYPPTSHRPKWLLVCKRGISGGYREVYFHQSDSILTALNGAFQRMADGTATWKVDEYDKKPDWHRD